MFACWKSRICWNYDNTSCNNDHADVPAAERHARGLTDGLVRLSVGIENKEDIIDDLKQALEKA